MSIGGWLSDNIFGTQNNFKALGPDGKPINSVGQSGYQATDANLPQFNFADPMRQSLANGQQNFNQQGDFISMLQGQANGQGPSVAQEMLRQQTQQNNQNASSMIASQRGMNPGLAQKMLLDQQANQNQQSVGQGALLRSQEMLGARGLLGSALGQQGAQNLQMFGQAGGMNQGQNALGLANHQGTQGLNASTAMGNAGMQTQGLGINAGVAQNNANAAGQAFGALASGIGSGAAMFATGGASAGAPAASASYPAALSMMAGGGRVPGKAPVSGDSPRNDTVDAKLSPGEVVLPRSVADDPEKAAEFVRAIRRKKSAESGEGYGKVLAMHREHEMRLRKLEAAE